MVVAHVVGMRPPDLFSWVAAIVLGGGVLGALITEGRARRVYAVLALVGLAGTVDDLIMRNQRPARPDLVIRLVSPPRRTREPLVVRVCGTTMRGQSTSATANGRYLVVRLDGVLVAEVHDSTVTVPVSHGPHRVTVEITSRDHQEFQPPLVVQRSVDVVSGGIAHPPSC